MLLGPIVFGGLLAACGGQGGGDTAGHSHQQAGAGDTSAGTDTSTTHDTGTGTDTSVNDDSGGGSDTSTGGEPWSGLDGTMCDDVAGYENVSGAATWWFGQYTRAGDSWSGTEYWVWFANDDCSAAGGSDCVVAWSVTATTTTPTCAGCDLGVAVSATVDASRTTCDRAVYQDDETWTSTYGIDVQGDQLTWYFDTSGTRFGAGTTDGTSYSYQSDGSCTWDCP